MSATSKLDRNRKTTNSCYLVSIPTAFAEQGPQLPILFFISSFSIGYMALHIGLDRHYHIANPVASANAIDNVHLYVGSETRS